MTGSRRGEEVNINKLDKTVIIIRMNNLLFIVIPQATIWDSWFTPDPPGLTFNLI